MRRMILMTLLSAALVASGGACTPDKVDSPDPTVPTAPSTTTIVATDTTASDPFAVPEQIDAAYVDRVLVELNKVYGDVARKVITTGELDRTDLDPLGAIFNSPLLDVQADAFADIPDLDRSLFRNPIGNRRMTVLEVITAEPDCIFVKVDIDVTDVLVNPPPTKEKYLTLGLKADGVPASTNPTPWAMAGESSAKQDSCAA